MWNLIKKDFMLCRSGIFLVVIFTIFLGPISFVLVMIPSLLNPKSLYSIYLLSFYLYIAYLLTLGTSIERHNKVDGDMIINSLPIDRATVIRSKYISPLLYLLAHSITHFLLSIIITSKGWSQIMKGHMDINARPINLFSMIGALALVLLILSINLYYTYSKEENQDKRAGIASIFSFIILASGPILNNILASRAMGAKSIENIIKSNREAIILMVFAMSIFAYLFSMEKLKRKLIE